MATRTNKSVKLLHLPHYRQGAHDGLCVYYSCAMLLASLFPQYGDAFGAEVDGPEQDPLLRATLAKNKASALARWFFRGEWVTTAAKILNRAVREGGHVGPNELLFKAAKFNWTNASEDPSPKLFESIALTLDDGFPVVLGWATKDFGNHAVLVTGYKIGDLKWLYLNDPGGDERIAWEALARSRTGRLEVLWVQDENFKGPRPDRAVTYSDGTETVERWWCLPGERGPRWHETGRLFEESMDWAGRRELPRNRVLSCLEAHRARPLTKSEICQITGLDDDSWSIAVRDLEAGELLDLQKTGASRTYLLKPARD